MITGEALGARTEKFRWRNSASESSLSNAKHIGQLGRSLEESSAKCFDSKSVMFTKNCFSKTLFSEY